MTDPHVPPSLARRIVLRHLPRVLRAGLDPDGLYGRVPAMLARDAGAIEPALGEAVLAWIAQGPARDCHPDLPDPVAQAKAGRGPRTLLRRFLLLRRERRAGRPAQVHPSEARALVDLLDRFAAANDSTPVREIADAVLLMAASPDDRSVAARLAASSWRDLPRIDESAAFLRLLDMAQAFDDDDEDGFVSAEASRHGLLPVPAPEDARAEALRRAWIEAVDAALAGLRMQARALALGLSAYAVGETDRYYGTEGIGSAALRYGEAVLGPVERRARADERRLAERAAARKAAEQSEKPPAAVDLLDPAVPDGHVLVCPAIGATGAAKGRDVTRGYEKVIGQPVPLVRTPDLARVRERLLHEFPQADEAVDVVLRDLVGKPFVRLSPLLIVGAPGGGKSRFVRRLGEELGTGVFRVDGSNDGGAAFGGTERRWYSSEPSRPFMAVNRYRQANPIVLVDELDKAPTRSDYGRLWDAMISFLEPETAARFPDPCVQNELDLSHVSVVATANVDWNLPAPLLDRLRRVEFRHPGREHLEALLPVLLAEAASERGIDPLWYQGLSPDEIAVLRKAWRGGSVRRLRRMLDALLRHRDRAAARH